MVVKKVAKTLLNSVYFARLFFFVLLVSESVVMAWVIFTQNDRLFYCLFSWPAIRTTLLTSLILLAIVVLIDQINEWTSVDLLSPSRKHIQVSLLRLNDLEHNGSEVRREVWRYVWNNCEDFWDTEFLSQNYRIQYDIIEDRLTL